MLTDPPHRFAGGGKVRARRVRAIKTFQILAVF
jgi:hypothetical protein